MVRRVAVLDLGENQVVVCECGLDFVAGGKFAVEQIEAEWVEDLALDDAFERACAVCGVVALASEERLGFVRERDAQVLLFQPIQEPLELDIHDAAELHVVEAVEDDDFVDPV